MEVGYPLSPYVLIPFARNELNVDGRRRREFNRKISKARIVVEWAFGRLKARFPALKKLGAVRNMRDIYRAIEAMMVVHNLCHQLGDSPNDFRAQHDDGEYPGGLDDNLDDDDELGEIDERNMGAGALNAGREFRRQCVDIICPL
ncbi:hypothetical protein FS749_000734 [Ceratobasidium sp. UAMH 11750]|nr:hypothetical protein FS749_000734 [Ceratobasidium sp. UAMH 11750]